MSELKSFQKDLSNDNDKKRHYVEKDYDTDEEEEDVEEYTVSVKNGNIDTMMMRELLRTQSQFVKSQKELFKLQTEIDTNEVHLRYLKLDLNNAQVNNDELKASNKELNMDVQRQRFEILAYRAFLLVQFLSLVLYTLNKF